MPAPRRRGALAIIAIGLFALSSACSNGTATTAATKGELDGAIRSAMGSRTVRVIDVQLPRDDMSPQLANMSAELARLRGAKGDAE